MADADEPSPDSPHSAADAVVWVEEAEAEAAAAEALAKAAQARARAARLRREALAMAETAEDYGDAAAAAADAEAAAAAAEEEATEYYDEDEDYDEDFEADEDDEEDEDYEADEDNVEDYPDESAEAAEPETPPAKWRRRLPPLSIVGKAAAIVSICFFVAIAVYMELQHHQATQRRAREAEFVAGAKQGVINMTSLDFNKAKEDVQRVIDSSTGEFKEDFQQRANTFTSVVQQSKAITEGTVNATALQSMNGNSASILVAATSRITNSPPGKDEPARVWRLKVTVTEVDGQYKMSKVEYVP
jgi:Mce-associated membrane protein